MAENGPTRLTKLDRVIEEYGLDGLAVDLERLWAGDGDRSLSIRELAAYVNQRILEASMREAEMRPLDGEVENRYRLLTDDGVSAGARIQARRDLERRGVDVERVTDDFVSHQTVYNYLTEERGVEYEREVSDQRERAQATVRRMTSRTEAIARSTLERLRDTDRLALGSFDVFLDLRVRCTDCGNAYGLIELLKSDGCECGRDSTDG